MGKKNQKYKKSNKNKKRKDIDANKTQKNTGEDEDLRGLIDKISAQKIEWIRNIKAGYIDLLILVKPNSKEDKIEADNSSFLLSVKAPPLKGKANQYIIKYLASFLNTTPNLVEIIRGHKSSEKIIRIYFEDESKSSTTTSTERKKSILSTILKLIN
ncbi:MAG: DUF167 domain-containing protein [Promethearchaeota archaeon]